MSLCSYYLGNISHFLYKLKLHGVLLHDARFFFVLKLNLLQKLAVDELKELKEDGMEVAMAGDGKYDSPGAGNLMKTFYLDSFLGWAAKYCTYIVQSLQTKKIVGLWVADKSMVISHKYLNKLTNQVKEKLFSLW